MDHHQIILCRGVTHINQLKYQCNVPVAGQIISNQPGPASFLSFGNFGVAIAGQIDKPHVIQAEKVDGGRLARHGADPGQLFAVEKLID